MADYKSLNLTEQPFIGESISRFQFGEYFPPTGTNINNTVPIKINIEMTDSFFLPSKAYIQVEGRLLKADGTSYANADVVTLTHNGIMHLFSRMEYDLSRQNIEKHIFGFCVLYGFKHNNAIFRSAAAAAGKVNLTKVSLWMPYITPSDTERLNLNSVIREKVTISVAFYSRPCETTNPQQTSKMTWKLGVKSDEKPRYIIVGFQTNRNNDQTQNASIFDHCNLTNMQVMINNVRFPEADYELSFPNQQFSRAHRDVSTFKENFYGKFEIISNCNITPSDYKDLYPLMVFDLSKQSERLKPSVSDI
ncbi:uncharacterized protein LOC136096635 [Hydra vulgaris]|uniref:uncharacterized protein LOC136096635 n=1 Tax=Hydra vulgaris TaxID=6087 RepID=UPI0032E9D10E